MEYSPPLSPFPTGAYSRLEVGSQKYMCSQHVLVPFSEKKSGYHFYPTPPPPLPCRRYMIM